MSAPQSKVVDLASFREAREQRSLPLFDTSESTSIPVADPPRALSGRQAEHRARMLRHLGGRSALEPQRSVIEI